MKTCSTCKHEKDESMFRRDVSRSDGLQPRCRDCASSKIKTDHELRYKDAARERMRTRATVNRVKLTELKRTMGCKFCTEREPVCLEFHHLDPTVKEFTIAHRQGSNIDKLLAEIEKCICVCSNCHAKIHAGLIYV